MAHVLPIVLMIRDAATAAEKVEESPAGSERRNTAVGALLRKLKSWDDDPEATARKVILGALLEHNNERQAACRALGIPSRTFYKLLHELNLFTDLDANVEAHALGAVGAR